MKSDDYTRARRWSRFRAGSLAVPRAAWRSGEGATASAGYTAATGNTLVEVLVIATLTTIVAGLAVSMLIAVRQWDDRQRDHHLRLEQVINLVRSIRRDIRSASAVELPEKETLVVRTSNNGEVQYKLQPDGCRRVAKQGPGEPLAVEQFAIGLADGWTLQRNDAGRLPLITLVAATRANRRHVNSTRELPLIVCGALGADLEQPSPTVVGDQE